MLNVGHAFGIMTWSNCCWCPCVELSSELLGHSSCAPRRLAPQPGRLACRRCSPGTAAAWRAKARLTDAARWSQAISILARQNRMFPRSGRLPAAGAGSRLPSYSTVFSVRPAAAWRSLSSPWHLITLTARRLRAPGPPGHAPFRRVTRSPGAGILSTRTAQAGSSWPPVLTRQSPTGPGSACWPARPRARPGSRISPA